MKQIMKNKPESLHTLGLPVGPFFRFRLLQGRNWLQCTLYSTEHYQRYTDKHTLACGRASLRKLRSKSSPMYGNVKVRSAIKSMGLAELLLTAALAPRSHGDGGKS